MHKPLQQALLFTLLTITSSCVIGFIPEAGEDQNLIVVEGLITDQPGQNNIKLSLSMPVGGKNSVKPLTRCSVSVSDDQGNTYALNETAAGTYAAGPTFRGIVGRYYTLHIYTNESRHNLSYESSPVLLKSVPAIDSVYYEKLVLSRMEDGFPNGEGCQIYLNTHDPENSCKFYRWEFAETWEFSLPYNVPYYHCWVTEYSDNINIKDASNFSENRIERQPVNFVSNGTDRLKEKYSILVNQYSMNEEEYIYWEKLRNMIEQVGSLYDIIPASIPSNVWCREDPDEKVMGYFSVSGVKSMRIFITERFRGIINLYTNCEHMVIYGPYLPEGIGSTIWLIIDNQSPPNPYKVFTYTRGCAECTVRGTTQRPDFW